MRYDNLIIEVLIEAGSNGLSVRKITHHVYNAVNGLFDEADWNVVHRMVRAFLHYHTKGTEPALSRPRRGVYSLNRTTAAGKRLLASVLDGSLSRPTPPPTAQELMLPLWDDE